MRRSSLLTLVFLTATSAWRVENGSVYRDGEKKQAVFHIRGCSWFGFETPDIVVNGLWAHPMEWYIDVLKSLGVTALRVPFSTEWVSDHWDDYPSHDFLEGDPTRAHKMSREIFADLFDLTEAAGIHIMLDMHRIDWTYISELWYDVYSNRYTSDDYRDAWFTILDEFGTRSNLMAVDLLNEPHGRATWGTGDPSTDWKMAAEEIINNLEERYPDSSWLYVVEGVGWGKDLTGARDQPLQPTESARQRVAYSAHNYGKSVVPSTPTENVWALHNDWDTYFGFMRDRGHALITGEYGGRTDVDAQWMQLYTDYLIERNATDAFFWSLGPNSGDVAGILLDDWTTVDQFKASIMKKLG
jgi:endoglucanase